MFLCPLLGFLIGGERGSCVVSGIGVSVVLIVGQWREKKIMLIPPVLWDREVDGNYS
jgi:hypothetical protein